MKNKFWEDFIIEGTEDYVGLWQIICRFHQAHPQANELEIQSMTLEAIREILKTGFMKIGMFKCVDDKKLEYQIWDLDIDNIINRIKTEWNELGREPNIGDVAWLITTEKGIEKAKRLLKERK